MGRCDCRKPSRRSLNVDGKGPSVADIAMYRSNLSVEDYEGHLAVSSENIERAMKDPDVKISEAQRD